MRTVCCSLLLVLLSSTSLAQWHRVPGPVTVHLSGVSFGSPSRGVITGYSGAILTTSDAGVSWQVAFPPPTSELIAEVRFLDSLKIVAAGNSNTLLSSTNGGVSWIYDAGGAGFFSHYYGIARSRHGTSPAVWVAGGRDFTSLTQIIQRPAESAPWALQIAGYAGRLVGIEMYDDTLGWAVGDLGVILRTSNGGRWWNTVQSGTTEGVNSVRFFDRNDGIAVGTNGLIMKSGDGGFTWRRVPYARTDLFFKVWIDGDSTAYAVGHNPTILRSTDRGETWARQTVEMPPGGLEDVWFTGRDTGWAVGNNGTILRTSNGGGPTGVAGVPADHPSSFTLLPPYPNPGNPSANVMFTIPRSAFVDVRLYDVLGREAARVLSRNLEPGTHTATLQGANLAAGTYLCRITFEGETLTAKVLLLR